MKCLVLGAGVVGVTTAYQLARDGHEVAVIDRQEAAGMETSFANGGQISANHATPWATPDVPAKIFKWLGHDDSPLLFRLRFDPALWSWGIRFLANCTSKKVAINTERALRLALYSRDVLADIRRETNIDYDQRMQGILHLYRNEQGLDAAIPQAKVMSDLGCMRTVLSLDDCLKLEPALNQCRDKIAGGILSPNDESGDALKFTQGLSDTCEGLGVIFHYQTTIRSIRADGNTITGVETNKGLMTADKYILALGSYSPHLLKPLGLKIPIYPAKGYSVTLADVADQMTPNLSLIDDEFKIVYSRLGNRLRIAGTAEFTGFDLSINHKRCQMILDKALDWFPQAATKDNATFWTGLRPMTPDSVPVIGETPFLNLLLNTGHGTLGWTMAAGSGRVLADLVGGNKPAINLDGLTLKRFS